MSILFKLYVIKQQQKILSLLQYMYYFFYERRAENV